MLALRSMLLPSYWYAQNYAFKTAYYAFEHCSKSSLAVGMLKIQIMLGGKVNFKLGFSILLNSSLLSLHSSHKMITVVHNNINIML